MRLRACGRGRVFSTLQRIARVERMKPTHILTNEWLLLAHFNLIQCPNGKWGERRRACWAPSATLRRWAPRREKKPRATNARTPGRIVHIKLFLSMPTTFQLLLLYSISCIRINPACPPPAESQWAQWPNYPSDCIVSGEGASGYFS